MTLPYNLPGMREILGLLRVSGVLLLALIVSKVSYASAATVSPTTGERKYVQPPSGAGSEK